MNAIYARATALRERRYCTACASLIAEDLLIVLVRLAGAEYDIAPPIEINELAAFDKSVIPSCHQCKRNAIRSLNQIIRSNLSIDELQSVIELLATTDFGDLTSEKFIFALVRYTRRLVAKEEQKVTFRDCETEADFGNTRSTFLARYLASLYGVNALDTKRLAEIAKEHYVQCLSLKSAQEEMKEQELEILKLEEQCNALTKQNLLFIEKRIARPQSAASAMVETPEIDRALIRQSISCQSPTITKTLLRPETAENVEVKYDRSEATSDTLAYYWQFKKIEEAKYKVPEVSKKVGLLEYENEMLREENQELLEMLERQGVKLPLEKRVETLETEVSSVTVEAKKFKMAYLDLCHQIFALRENKEIFICPDEQYLQYYTNIFSNISKDLRTADYMSFEQHYDLVRRYILEEYANEFVAEQTKMTETALRFQKVYSALYEEYLFQFIKGIPVYQNFDRTQNFALFWDFEATFEYKMNCVMAILSIYGFVAAEVNGELVLVEAQ